MTTVKKKRPLRPNAFVSFAQKFQALLNWKIQLSCEFKIPQSLINKQQVSIHIYLHKMKVETHAYEYATLFLFKKKKSKAFHSALASSRSRALRRLVAVLGVDYEHMISSILCASFCYCCSVTTDVFEQSCNKTIRKFSKHM